MTSTAYIHSQVHAVTDCRCYWRGLEGAPTPLLTSTPPVCLTEQSTSILTNSIISRQTARNAAIKRISSDGASFTRLIKSRRTTVGCQGLETSLSWVFITERTKTGFRRRNAVVWPACHMSWLRSATRRYPLNGGEASPVIKHLTVECLELNIKCHILSTFQRSLRVLLLFLTSVQRDWISLSFILTTSNINSLHFVPRWVNLQYPAPWVCNAT